ncbi:Bromodomain containing protein [Tritrichomonas foetus]|uniref:Bromodomain containing protein n=1 Tax=Tritrichomonas foetus TaxID=1144522 RepID=A0A1J4KJ98_9EUKA|nr:Bromodomain containing protein [Tritrichomonas foetus]|eukprot:OHT11291.1 Bromodomain containing protein [Tritrichomonas foetus]
MDFSTMKKKLQGNEYPTVQSFIDDIQLICDNAKTFNGETSIFGLICDDIMDEVNKQYSEKADNADEEWYKSLNKAIMLMNDHINSPPPEVAAIQKDTPFPSIQDLENEQISKIESIIGGESIETLEKRWYLLSDHARRSIIDVIENRDDDEGENSNNSNDDE